MSARAFAYVAGGAGAPSSAATFPTPLLLAPVGVLELVHPDADLAVARAIRWELGEFEAPP